MSDHLCALCAQPFAEAEMVILNGNKEQVQKLTEALDKRRAKRKRERAGKKRRLESKADASAL